MKMKHVPKEWELISSIQKIVRRDKIGTLIPLGDDAFATEAPTQPLVMAQDMMIEAVHFDLNYSTAQDLGHKALAVNLSDFAAMGATPRWIQVSLGLTEKQNKLWLEQFYHGMSALADHFDVEIVGGDLCHSPKCLVIDVGVVGTATHPISRKGAEVGDLLVCSGPLGLSAQGLEALRGGLKLRNCIENHLRPNPRLDLLPQLQKHALKIHGLIDVSDGLVSECLHLTRHLELGLDLWVEKIPSHPEVTSIQKVLWGGDDYELLMALSEQDLHLFPDWIPVGKFVNQKEITLVSDNAAREVVEDFKGWRHF